MKELEPLQYYDALPYHRSPASLLSEERIVLIIAIISGFLTPFDGSATNIALPFISGEFHMDAVSLSWVATAYLLASALVIVPFGKIADIHGRKKVFLAGLSIFTLASLLMTMVPSTPALIGMRVIQGAGSGMIFGTAVAILTSVVPKQRRGRALGIYITSVYLGLTLGPPLGGVLTQYFGWRSIFLVNVPIGVAAVLLVLWKLKGEWADCRRRTVRPGRLSDLRCRAGGDDVRLLTTPVTLPAGPDRRRAGRDFGLCLV